MSSVRNVYAYRLSFQLIISFLYRDLRYHEQSWLIVISIADVRSTVTVGCLSFIVAIFVLQVPPCCTLASLLCSWKSLLELLLTSVHTFLLEMSWMNATVPVFGKYVYPTVRMGREP